MKQKLEIDKIRDRIYEDLQPSGWGRVLRTFIYSSDFDNILHSLVVEVNAGNRFTPPLKDVFRAFKECPYDALKVVIVGQDPYPTIDVADGIAFSCSKSKTPGQIQPSLKFILQEVNRTIYNDDYVSINPDLSRWSRQGVLMLNTALTTEIGKIGKHYEIWKPFLNYLFDYLSNYNNGLVYIYMGKQASTWADSVNDNCFKLFCTHPASAIYNKSNRWDSKDVFHIAQKLVEENYKYLILW
jgi:uracil-DNA glycosylase